MKQEITDNWLRDKVEPPATGRLEVWDTRVPCLVLRITPAGVATWSVRARTRDGKRTRPALGTWPAVGISEARKRARQQLAAIQGGADPVLDKRSARVERSARAAEPTVAQRMTEWLAEREADLVKPFRPRTADEYRRMMNREILPRLGARPLRETTREHWTGIVAAKRRTAPAMASLLYRCISAFLGHAEARGWIPAPLLPRKGLATIAPPAASRKRVLTYAELRAVWRASEGFSPKTRAFVRLLVLTGVREIEVADIAVGEVDLAAASWIIPGARTKNGQPHKVPLCRLAMSEIEAVWPRDGEEVGVDGRLLGQIPGGGLRGFSKLKVRLDAASGVTGWRFHDLRRTARTGMTALGVGRDVAELAINHISGRSALQRIYDQHDYSEEIAAALKAWQGHVASVVGQGHC
jgi:integrase